MIVIRKAKDGDADRLFSILVEATQAGCIGFYPEEISDDWHRGRTARGMREVVAKETFYTLSEYDGVKGFLHLNDQEIVGLFVDPKEHGKRHGRALLLFALKEIKERPIKVYATLNAVGFYTKFGFEKVKLVVVRRNERDIYVWEMRLV